jgi:hypothetical protein
MIAWINGAFGAGKTTAAAHLLEAVHDAPDMPEARLFDPEYVGYLLRKFVPVPTGDFQDLRLWRALTVQTLSGLDREYPGIWIVPMTLVNRAYRAEIHDGLRHLGHIVHHAVLVLPEPVLRERIDNDQVDAGARQWRQDHAASAVAELPGLGTTEPDTHAIDATQPPERVAAEILLHLTK